MVALDGMSASAAVCGIRSRLENVRLRQVISCAGCAYCADPIGDREWDITEDERLVHEDCVEPYNTEQENH